MSESSVKGPSGSTPSKPRVVIVREYDDTSIADGKGSMSSGTSPSRKDPVLTDSGTIRSSSHRPSLRNSVGPKVFASSAGGKAPSLEGNNSMRGQQDMQQRMQRMREGVSYWDKEPELSPPATQPNPPAIIITPDDESPPEVPPEIDVRAGDQDNNQQAVVREDEKGPGKEVNQSERREDQIDGRIENDVSHTTEEREIYRDVTRPNQTNPPVDNSRDVRLWNEKSGPYNIDDGSCVTSESDWEMNNSNAQYRTQPSYEYVVQQWEGGGAFSPKSQPQWGSWGKDEGYSVPHTPRTSFISRGMQDDGALTHAESICLSELKLALDGGHIQRASFVIQSVANRSQSEWMRLFRHLSLEYQQLLISNKLHPFTITCPAGDMRHETVMKEYEVDRIICRHQFDHFNYQLRNINGQSQELPSMSQEKAEDPVEDVRKKYESELSLLKQKNQSIPNRDLSLESQLKKANNEISFLKDQVHGLRVQLGVWPDRVTQLEEENATLKEKLSDCRTANQQCRRELMSTQDRLQETLHHQQFNSHTPTTPQAESRLSCSDHRLLQRVLEDYDNLQREHDRVRTQLAETEGRLYEARNESCEHAKRVANLEMEVQRLESETHALRRRSIYEMARPSATPSSINGLKERDISPTASLRIRSTSRPTLYRELSLDRHTMIDDHSPEEKSVPDIMSMSLPPSALEAALGSGRETPRPHSPPVRLPAGNSRLPPSYHDIKMMERKYDQLQQEKRRMEAALSHLPARALNPRLRREIRQERYETTNN